MHRATSAIQLWLKWLGRQRIERYVELDCDGRRARDWARMERPASTSSEGKNGNRNRVACILNGTPVHVVHVHRCVLAPMQPKGKHPIPDVTVSTLLERSI